MGQLLTAPMYCRKCNKPLDLEEMHYYGDTCNACEADWLVAIEAWRHGELEELPER